MAAPSYAADGFRSEKCARCGDVIGFAFFTAREYVMGGNLTDGFVTVTNFWHTNRDRSIPTWCETKKEA